MGRDGATSGPVRRARRATEARVRRAAPREKAHRAAAAPFASPPTFLAGPLKKSRRRNAHAASARKAATKIAHASFCRWMSAPVVITPICLGEPHPSAPNGPAPIVA